ncbi:MAG: hypothetical protein CV087_13495 [Candidatus Brocadia sp. WS118]|nr:MAG: hypothetical protein CV087_13495 [Candidatus Brocadia sp. WS118]
MIKTMSSFLKIKNHASTSNIDYEKLPLVDLHAPKALSLRNRTRTATSNDSLVQNLEDAKTILELAGLCVNLSVENIIHAREKYMVETPPYNKTVPSLQNSDGGMRQKGGRRPHYSHLFVLDDTLIFQSSCCLPLKVIAASLDGNPVSGRVLFARHSEEGGGKLAYEFQGKGTEIIIDLQRGESSRAQRHIFRKM